MSDQTAGKQLQKGFYIIIAFMLIVCIIAFSSLLMIERSLSSIKKDINLITEVYQPIIKSTEAINAYALDAQLSLMRYIAEYEKDTKMVSARINRLNQELNKAMEFVTNKDLKNKLLAMSIDVKKMEKTVRLVVLAETWEAKDELVNSSFGRSEKMVKMANEIRQTAYKDIDLKVVDINKKNEEANKKSKIAKGVLFLIFILTILNIFIIFRWWKRFQEFLLEF